MPNFAGAPVAGSGNVTYGCTRDCCKDKPPRIKYIDQYVVLKPRPPMYTRAMLSTTVRVWYCCHCNNKLSQEECKGLEDVIGLEIAPESQAPTI